MEEDEAMLDCNMVGRLGVLAAVTAIACEGGAGVEAPELRAFDLAPRPPAAERAGELIRAEPSRADAGMPACTLSPDCESVPLVFLELGACCTATTSCGLEVRNGPPDLRETVASVLELGEGETCAPRDRFFLTHPGSEDLRVATDTGEEILLTTGCNTASILSISFIGCCMPSNRCGVSTYGVWDTIGVLAPGAPFSRLQCVSSKTLNQQLEHSQFRGLRFLPDTDAPCDHAALDAQLPPVEPSPY